MDFLQRFHDGKLGITDESTKVVSDLLILEETPEYRLSGKSGWVGLGEEGTQWGLPMIVAAIIVRRNPEACRPIETG